MRRSILVLYNISKMNNAYNLCLSAFINGFEVAIIGLKTHEKLESQLSSHAVVQSNPLLYTIKRFESISDIKVYLNDTNDDSNRMKLYGLEIIDDAISILDFNQNMLPLALMPGNEGHGLNQKQKDACDDYNYIPQFGTGTASLNVNVATNIVLHHIAFPM